MRNGEMRRMSIRVTPWQYEQMELIAKKQNIPMNVVVRELIYRSLTLASSQDSQEQTN